LTTVFDFPMFFAIRDVLTQGAPAGRIANVLRQDSLYPHPEYLVPFFANHDVKRFASLSGATPENLKLAFGLALTLRGIPEIYYGDEIGMQGGDDPDNRRDFPGGWIGDKENGFTQQGRSAKEQQVFEYVRALLKVRREHDAFRGGKLWHLYSDDETYVFVRESENEKLAVAFENGTKARDLTIPVKDTPAQGVRSLKAIFGEGQAESAALGIKVHLPSQSLTVFELH
jgi:glycosidase